MKREAKFNTIFNKWLKQARRTGLYELKQTTGNSIPFASVVPHQVDALYNVKHSTLVYKIPDVGYQNPADCFSLSEQEACVVLKFPGAFYLIDIDTWIHESEYSERKSITHMRAKELSTVEVLL